MIVEKDLENTKYEWQATARSVIPVNRQTAVRLHNIGEQIRPNPFYDKLKWEGEDETASNRSGHSSSNVSPQPTV